MIFCWIFCESMFSFTRSRRSDTDCPEVERNFSNSAGFGNCWCLMWRNWFSTSLSETLTPSDFASPSTHEEEIRKPRTSCCSDLYCCWHWVFSAASVGAFWPLAGFGAVAFRCAIQAVYCGGTGTVCFSPVAVVEAAATLSQWP